MKKILFSAAMILMMSQICFAEEIPQRIDGRVVRLDEVKRILLVNYEEPASGKHVEQEFFVAEDARFKDFKKLSQLKQGDLISLDYLDYKPIPKVIYAIKIPLEKTYFTHKEVAGALLKIKATHQNTDVAKTKN